MSKTYSAGIVTAYGAAKRAGYQGTYEDFCRQQAGYAESAATVEQAKNTAVSASQSADQAKQDALTARDQAQTAKAQTEAAASQALTDIGTARTAAVNAVQTEGQTQTANASAQAQAAAQSANTASTKASEASASATSAGQSATNAAASATSAAQSASDAQDVLDSIPADYSDLSANVSQLRADLDHPVKSAEQLISDKRTADKVPYKYRASQSGKSDRAYDMIVGGTVCFNQLIQNGDFSDGTTGFIGNNGSISASNGVLIFTASSGSGRKNFMTGNNNTAPDAIVGHKYFYSFYVKVSTTDIGSTFAYSPLTNNGSVSKALTANTDTNIIGIRACTQAGKVRLYVYPWGVDSSTTDGTETCSAHDFMIIDLTSMFGVAIADYIYSLEQATAGAGVSLFRAMFPNNYYAYNAGELISVAGLSAHVMRDADDNIIGSYSLDSSLTLRGIPKLVDGKIEFDGDTYASDGTVKRRYGIVDLGSLSWQYNSTNKAFIATELNPSIKPTASNTDVPKFIQNKYNQLPRNQVTLGTSDKVICENTTGSIVVSDLSYTDVTAFKASLSGVYLVYELATPTTETATPYTSTQIVDPYGTEEYVSTSVCPIGHITEYPDNLRAKIDGLPWDLSMIAPVETAYKATRNYTTGNLLIVDNTLYKVTANIANGGTITPNTNVLATTLSEVIASLS